MDLANGPESSFTVATRAELIGAITRRAFVDSGCV
jgi:hypothetical protein